MMPVESTTIIRAKVLGFCMGVRRAVEMTQGALSDSATAADSTGRSIYTLGPLIHNPQVLSSLFSQGVRVLEEEILFSDMAPPNELSGATVIIRAHGVSPLVEDKLREKKARIIDATCPRVKANQLAAREKAKNGYRIFLAGERDHAELKGIYSYALSGSSSFKDDPDNKPWCVIAGNPEEAKNAAIALLEKEPNAKTALIGQTTISEDEYKAIAQAVKQFFPHLDVQDTICGATRDRQNALKELCAQAETIIVIGGKDSANTRRLLSIAHGCGKKAFLVESASALPPLEADHGVIGISAGASTPDNVIDEVEEALVKAPI